MAGMRVARCFNRFMTMRKNLLWKRVDFTLDDNYSVGGTAGFRIRW